MNTTLTPETVDAPKTQNERERRPRMAKNARGRSRRPERTRPEFDHRVIDVRRVTRVVAGGRRFSFSVALVLGNRNGMVGVGMGKAGDTALAIDKATRSARKKMITLPLNKQKMIPHAVEAKYASARLMLYPAVGKGLGAGSAVRTVLELAGIRDVGSKILSPSKNKINIARCTIHALAQLRSTHKKNRT